MSATEQSDRAVIVCCDRNFFHLALFMIRQIDFHNSNRTYRRILYLDSDIFVEGCDISRLLEVDIGPHPLAAVLDAPFFYEPNHRANEFVKAGLPAVPYANSGVQVIDTKLFVEQVSQIVLRHLRGRKLMAGIIARHPDPYLALI